MSTRLRDALCNFLHGDAAIHHVNFNISGWKVYPSAYSIDVWQKLYTGDIRLLMKNSLLRSGLSAQYNWGSNSFTLPPTFEPAWYAGNLYARAIFLHEATHCHIDNQSAGKHSKALTEAIAYLAEAIWLRTTAKAKGTTPEAILKSVSALNTMKLGATPVSTIDKVALGIAAKVLKGDYVVSGMDVRALRNAITSHPNGPKPSETVNSDGVSLPWYKQHLPRRRLPGGR